MSSYMLCSLYVVCLSPPSPQEKNNLEIDLNYKLKTLQQRLEQEQTEHRVTRAQLTDKYESIEEAKSAAMHGTPTRPCLSLYIVLVLSVFHVFIVSHSPLLYLSITLLCPTFNVSLTPSLPLCSVFLFSTYCSDIRSI